MLRSYPKDAALGKIINTLIKEYKVECFLWDRQRDYQPLIHDNIRYARCRIKADYYTVNTFFKLFLFDLWVFIKLLFAEVDCVHAIDLDTGFAGLCAAKLRNKPFVYQCLDPYYAALPKGWPKFLAIFAQWLENRVISHADLFVITDLLRMPQHEGSRPKRVVEIANVPYLAVPAFAGTQRTDFVVGYIGSLAEGRNLTTTVEALGKLKDEGITLVVGGFGPLADVIERYAGKYDNVTFIPWVPYEKLLELQAGFDLFLSVTDKDKETYRWVSPNKLFESMAFGKPIIVGDGTLAARRVAAVGNGVAVPYGSEEELQKAIRMFKENPALAGEMGTKGKAEYDCYWRPEVMEKRLREAYAELMG